MHLDWFLFIILWNVDRCMNDFTINSILPFFIKQIHSMLSWVSSVKDNRCQSVVRKSVKHSALFVAWKKSCYLKCNLSLEERRNFFTLMITVQFQPTIFFMDSLMCVATSDTILRAADKKKRANKLWSNVIHNSAYH